MKPYANLQTNNLSLLLISARILAVFGIIVICAAILASLSTLFSGGFGGYGSHTNGSLLLIPSLVGFLWGVISGVALLAFSGLCAAVVSIEFKYTIE